MPVSRSAGFGSRRYPQSHGPRIHDRLGFAIWASRTRRGPGTSGLLAPRSQSAPERRSTVPGRLQRWRTVSPYHAMRRPQGKISPVERDGFDPRSSADPRSSTCVIARTAPSRFSGHLRQQVASSEIRERGFRITTEGDTQAKEVLRAEGYDDQPRAADRSQGRRGGGVNVFHPEMHHRGKVRRCAISEDAPGNRRRTARRSRVPRPSARRS